MCPIVSPIICCTWCIPEHENIFLYSSTSHFVLKLQLSNKNDCTVDFTFQSAYVVPVVFCNIVLKSRSRLLHCCRLYVSLGYRQVVITVLLTLGEALVGFLHSRIWRLDSCRCFHVVRSVKMSDIWPSTAQSGLLLP